MGRLDLQRRQHYSDAIDELSRRFRGAPHRAMMAIFDVVSTRDLLLRFVAMRVERQGLSFAGFQILMLLSKEPAAQCPMHLLADWLFVSRQNVTGVVDVLERKNLVIRRPSESDRRVKLVALTDGGFAALERIVPEHFDATRHLFGEMTDDELADLHRVLSKLRERLLVVGPTLEPNFPGEMPLPLKARLAALEDGELECPSLGLVPPPAESSPRKRARAPRAPRAPSRPRPR